MQRIIKEDERYDLVNTPVTLNGQPAQIAGAKMDFPIVRNIETGEHYEYAWQTVAHVVANGGNFKS
jgi:hypothetical protein